VVFEYLSCDHIPFCKIVEGVQRSSSIRGFTGMIFFADRATGKLFIYICSEEKFRMVIMPKGLYE
jgi:hypothetical protein